MPQRSASPEMRDRQASREKHATRKQKDLTTLFFSLLPPETRYSKSKNRRVHKDQKHRNKARGMLNMDPSHAETTRKATENLSKARTKKKKKARLAATLAMIKHQHTSIIFYYLLPTTPRHCQRNAAQSCSLFFLSRDRHPLDLYQRHSS